MGALSASTSSVNWPVEDDILLKNAVETGASLESLAKGAVCFSRKFTLQEIRDRWNSLLYDPEISTQASSRMAEYENELSTSDPAKAHKLFNSKAKDFSFQKRKIDSVKSLYYAMRKRVCNDPCNTADLGFLVGPCSCIATGSECVCGGLPKLSQGHHFINNIEPGLSSVSRYGQVGASFNSGHVYAEMNGHSFHAKHTESIVRDGDATNNVPYGYSDIDQIYEHHAYAAKNHGSSEGNDASLKGITDFQGMHFQQLDSNQCDNRVAESKTLVIPNQLRVEHSHFSGSVQEPIPLQVIGQSEGSQARGGAIWREVHERDAHTLAGDKKVKSENRDRLTFQANLDGGICTPENDFIDFPFFSNGEEFDILNGENFLNSPSEANQEDFDDPAPKIVPGVRSTMQDLTHPNETKMSCDHIDPDHVKNNVVDVSSVTLIPTSLEVPCPGQYVECKLNTEDPEIPCNDDVTPGEYHVECSTSTFGQKSENNICSVSPATSPPSNADHSKASDNIALIKGGDLGNVQPSSQTMKLSPSTSEQKEGSVAPKKSGVIGAKPSEVPSTEAVFFYW
uniref:Microspherule protein N-terminal domain-containing protein n=1 Tax=Arundo donax TaxID=35708 RepID=A0A0A9DJL4_ARUDO